LTITEPLVANLVNSVIHRRRITLTYTPNHVKQSELVEDIGGSGAPDASRTTTYQYDQNDREISSISPFGTMGPQRTYDAVGNVVTQTDPNGNLIQTTYNARNLPTAVTLMLYTDPSGLNATNQRQLASMTYDGAGRMITQTDGNYRTRSFTYDAMDRLLTRVLQTFRDRNGAARSITEASSVYNQIGLKTIERSGGNGLVHAYVYDQAGRLVQDNNQSQPRWDWFTLDRNGNVTSAQRVTTGNVVLSKKDTLYDARNRPTSVTVDMGGVVPNRTTLYTYNKFGTVAQETDPLNAVSNFWYDELGRVSYVVAPSASHEDVGGSPSTSGVAVTKGYDTFGNVSHERDAKGAITTSSYDKQNRRTRVDHPACTSGCQSPSAYETWAYDNNGNAVSYRNRRGGVTDYLYDSLNQNVKQLLPDPGTGYRPSKTSQYDLAGNVLQTTSEAGVWRSYTYNERNLLKTDNLNGSFDYNDLGQAVWTAQALGNASVHEYLPTGERTKTTDPIGAVSTAEYDGLGRQTKATDPMGRITTFEYNRASEPTATKRWVSGAVYSTESATYDNAGSLKSTANPVGVTTQYNYDPMRRLTSTVMPAGGLNITNSYGYDRNSNLTRSTDGNTAVTTYTYNQWNLQTSTVEPSTPTYPAVADRTYTTTYDSGGLPVAETEPGTAVARTFDPLGHPTAATWTGAGLATVQKNYTFDAAGRLTQVTDGASTANFGWNYRNQVTSSYAYEGVYNGQVHYQGMQYDANGNMISRDQSNYWGNGSSFTFAYNTRNELTNVSSNVGTPEYRVYDLSGLITDKMQGWQYQLRNRYQYDGIGRLVSHTMTDPPMAYFYGSIGYSYFADDSLQAKNVSFPGSPATGSNSYTYDLADRLKTWTSSAGAISYNYDSAGNRTGAGSQAFSYDARNRLTTSTGSTYLWAARGTPVNQTVNGQPTTYTTDAADRTSSVAGPGGTVSYLFDGLDRVRTRSLNGGNPVVSWYGAFDKGAYEEKNSDWTELQQYARLPNGTAYSTWPNSASFAVGAIVTDLHGDAIAWFHGSLGSTKSYDPFGKVIASTGTPSYFGYQGDYTDPTTGDVNMGARWYNPSTATFRSRDTYMGTLQTPFSLNRYTYGLNNPLRYSDPTGHYAEHAGCYRDDRSYDWDCDHAANDDGGGVETDHPLYENADGTTKTNIFDVVDLGGGDSQISVTSSSGTTVSTSTSTVRTGTHAAGATEVSGNLSYTPKAATDEERIILFKQGNTPNAIADAAHDDRKVANGLDSEVSSQSQPDQLALKKPKRRGVTLSQAAVDVTNAVRAASANANWDTEFCNNIQAPGITAGAHLGCSLDSIQNAVHSHPKSSKGTGTSSSQWFSLTDLKLVISGGVGNLFILVTQNQTLVATSSTVVDPAAVENFLQTDFKLENQTTCASVSANFSRWDACNQRVFKSQNLRFAKEFGIDLFMLSSTKDVTTSSFFEKVTK
jgi:RHS repeat-associated protein